jgi:hypothetical protein
LASGSLISSAIARRAAIWLANPSSWNGSGSRNGHIVCILGHPVVEAPMQRIGFAVSPGFQVMHFAALSGNQVVPSTKASYHGVSLKITHLVTSEAG